MPYGTLPGGTALSISHASAAAPAAYSQPAFLKRQKSTISITAIAPTVTG